MSNLPIGLKYIMLYGLCDYYFILKIFIYSTMVVHILLHRRKDKLPALSNLQSGFLILQRLVHVLLLLNLHHEEKPMALSHKAQVIWACCT